MLDNKTSSYENWFQDNWIHIAVDVYLSSDDFMTMFSVASRKYSIKWTWSVVKLTLDRYRNCSPNGIEIAVS